MERKGMIFDMDGTILESMYIWETAASDYIKSLNIVPKDNLDENVIKLSLLESAKYMKNEYKLKINIAEIMNGINQNIEQKYFNEIGLKDNIIYLLEKLKTLNISMCIATATDKYLAEAVLINNNIRKYFDYIVTCTEVGAGKDKPLVFNVAREKIGTRIENTYVLEDSLHALETVKGEGYKTIGVFDNSALKNQQDIKEIVDIYIDDTYDFQSIINKIK